MKNILIAMPTFQTVDPAACLALTMNALNLERRGYNVSVHIERGCYLPIARERCLKVFMDGDYTDLIFMDSDMVFDVDAMCKLIQYDGVGVIGGICPYKKDEESYPVHIMTDEAGIPMVNPQGLIECHYIGTGLVRIERKTIENMNLFYPSKLDNGSFMHFDCGNLLGNGKWYGEDVYFCKRWRAIGGRVWAYPNITFGHHGDKEYIGNYHEYLMRLPGGINAK